ncbi:MAG: DUF2110 family protein [Candidatus Thorarchaeota archaeon]
MITLTLLTKIRDNKQLKQVRKSLKTLLNGLEVEIKILGTVAGGWFQISLSGEDEEIATNYLIQKIGLCPGSFDTLKKISTLKGYINNIRKNGSGLSVDVGIFQPEIVQAVVPLSNLQTELVDGRNVALRTIADLFGFCEGLPVKVEVNGLDENKLLVDARLSSEQISKYEVWRESLLDRLLVIYPSLQEIEVAIKHTRLYRDVIDVEPLGFFAHALTCKLGTDAAGLIPKIGKNLKNARFAVFNPVTLRNFLKNPKN